MLRLFENRGPEEFSEKYRYQSLLEEILKRCESIQRELEKIEIAPQSIVDPILRKIEVAVEEILLAMEDSEQVEEEPLKTVDVSERIVALLSQKESMSFTELLDALGVAKTTLSRHLNKLLEENKIERIETDRKVLYRLKGSESSEVNPDTKSNSER